MVREIKFRGKRIDNGEWAEGYYEHYNGRDYINKQSDRLNSGGYPIRELYEVYSATVCQYTGLTDKNCEEIYEGDIIRFNGNDKDIARVVFGEFYVVDMESLDKIDSVIGWHYEPIPTDAISRCEPFCYHMPLTDEYIERCKLEVISNIYEI